MPGDFPLSFNVLKSSIDCNRPSFHEKSIAPYTYTTHSIIFCVFVSAKKRNFYRAWKACLRSVRRLSIRLRVRLWTIAILQVSESGFPRNYVVTLTWLHFTVVPVMSGHPRDHAKVSVHCRWPLIRGTDG